MRTLFAKIFIWFFVSLAVIVLASYGMTRVLSRDPAMIMHRWGDPFSLHADYAREALARDGRAGLVRFLDHLDGASRLRAYDIDRSGRELRDRPVPPGVDELARDLFAGKETQDNRDRPYFAYRLGGSADLDSSVLVIAPPQGPRHLFPRRPPHDEVLLLVLIGVGGIFCYGLARHLTSPVTRLRHAVAKLASGDLSARVENARGMSGDELVALGHEFNRMAERIETLVASHRQLLRDVSHELRSPLARIRVAVGLAQQHQQEHLAPGAEPVVEGGESTDRLLGRIEREAERLEALIAQILTLSRLETRSAGTTDIERFDLAELVEGVAEDARFEAAAKRIEVHLDAVESVFVDGEASVLRSAIENVVRNAVRVSAGGSAVEVALAREPGPGADPARAHAVVRVLDRGPGVPELELETIFEPFTRSEKSRDRKSGGVGLGLAIARRAIESHGGSIRARPRAGGGLVVEMRVPMNGVVAEGKG